MAPVPPRRWGPSADGPAAAPGPGARPAVAQRSTRNGAHGEVRARHGARISSRERAIDALPRPRRWIAGCLLGALVMAPLPCAAFSADGLHTGMTLEEVKKDPELQGKEIKYLFEADNLEVFHIDHFGFIWFCHNNLVSYSRFIKDPKSLIEIGELMRNYNYKITMKNEIMRSIHDIKEYYESRYEWSILEEKYELYVFSKYPMSLTDIKEVGIVEKSIDFDKSEPREVLATGRACI